MVNLLRGQSVILLVHHISSSPRTAFTLQPLPQGDTYAGPRTHTATCWCSTVLFSLLSACQECQGDPLSTYVSNPPCAFWAYLFLVGHISQKTAHVEMCLLRRESIVVTRGFLVLTENILSVSLILFLLEYACPIGRLLISQFVTY
jgi:hypothetical protein